MGELFVLNPPCLNPLCLDPVLHSRSLELLLLLGCMKCATTLLHRLVVKTCPQSVTQGRAFRDESWFRVKEKHYYDRDESETNDLKTYVSHFPRCPRSRKVLGIDSTQAYLKTPAAAPPAAAPPAPPRLCVLCFWLFHIICFY